MKNTITNRFKILAYLLWIGIKLLLTSPILIPLIFLYISMFFVEITIIKAIIYFPIWLLTGIMYHYCVTYMLDNIIDFIVNKIVFN